MLLVFAGCTAVRPAPRSLELFVNYTSGGVWPRGVSVRIYSDGSLSLDDGENQVRRHVSPGNPTFQKILAAVGTAAFREELEAAAVPSQEWRSSGAWIRLERQGTVALVKPPVARPHIRAVLEDLNTLFTDVFGKRRYRGIATE